MANREHWEAVYASKSDDQLSWLEAQPQMSLQIIRELSSLPSVAIDVGGGQSRLAGHLVQMGVADVTVLDLSASALERAKQRLGPLAARVHWLIGDILSDVQIGHVDLWHDRAVLHFLTERQHRERYFARLRETLRPGGVAIMAGFALDGPKRCSGLDVMQIDAAQLAAEMGPGFCLIREDKQTHLTPWGERQWFTYTTFRSNVNA